MKVKHGDLVVVLTKGCRSFRPESLLPDMSAVVLFGACIEGVVLRDK